MSKDNWKTVGKRPRAGMLAPLFSVYSKDSMGIGDFCDLKLLVDLVAKMGGSILQLLPMNETGPIFCPYDAISSFALEPVYISFRGTAATKSKLIKAEVDKIRKMFPCGLSHVNYGVKDSKHRLLHMLFKKDGHDSKEYKLFKKDNSYWLDDFALFKAIKKEQGARPWYEWDEGYRNRDVGALEAFRKEHAEELDFQKWVQWVAFEQYKEAKSYAESKRVLICGDLPILTSRDSADVWAHPQFFKLDFAAGAPPDMYCAKGQRWGMPTYDWEAIAADGYRYIKEKLKFAENFYDILRIDHAVGLFRIWSIPYNEPLENEGLNGVFDPADEKEWGPHGKQILSILCGSTKMLLVAEDLGMIPKICPETLKEFEVPGNDVQRWTKDWNIKHDFLEPQAYRRYAVSMLSTHDTTNWAAWWENEAGTIDEALFIRKCGDRGIDYASVKDKLFDPSHSGHGRLRWLGGIASKDNLAYILGKRPEELADFIDIYENTCREKEKLWKKLGMKGPMRESSGAEAVGAALGITLNSRSIFCIELLIDYLYLADIFKGDPYKYRINRPGTISRENWSLVVPVGLEELLKHRACGQIKKMIGASNRI